MLGSITHGGNDTTWTLASYDKPFGIDAIAYGNGMFVAGGYKIGSTDNILYSADGVTWTVGTKIVDSDTGYELSGIYLYTYGNGIYIGYKENENKLRTSTDGVIWTRRDSVVGGKIIYVNSKFVALSSQEGLVYSSDGITWEKGGEDKDSLWTALKDKYYTTTLYAFAYGNNRYVVSGTNGHMAYLLDN
jgi:hypothetical protein